MYVEPVVWKREEGLLQKAMASRIAFMDRHDVRTASGAHIGVLGVGRVGFRTETQIPLVSDDRFHTRIPAEPGAFAFGLGVLFRPFLFLVHQR